MILMDRYTPGYYTMNSEYERRCIVVESSASG